MRRCRPPITATPTIALDSRRRPGCLLTEFRGRPTRNGCPRRRPPPATLIEQGSVKVRIGLEATGCSNVARKTAARRCKRQRQLVWRSARVKQVYMRWLCGDGQLTVGDHCALHQPFQTLHLCHLLFFFQDRRSTASPLVAPSPADVRDAFVPSSGGARCVLPATFTGGRQSRTSTFFFLLILGQFYTVISPPPHPKLS